METVYSKRLGPISDAQFQRALDRFDLGTFVTAEPTTGGLFGQNVFVSSSKGTFRPARLPALRLAISEGAVLRMRPC